MPDYVKLAAVAKRLIENAGRNVTFRRLEREVDNPAQPWRGSVDPRTPGDENVVVRAAFVDPVSAAKMGLGISSEDDLVSRIDSVALVAATSTSLDLERCDEVIDNGTLCRIEHMEVLKPGDVKLLYIALLVSTGKAPTIQSTSAFTLGFDAGYH